MSLEMRQAEEILFKQISKAFDGVSSVVKDGKFKRWQDIPDLWIEQSDAFAWAGNDDELFLLPAFLIYLLQNIDTAVNESVWLHIESTLGEYSKGKTDKSFKMMLSNAQFSAVKAFIKHVAHNVAPDFDRETWFKILDRWKR